MPRFIAPGTVSPEPKKRTAILLRFCFAFVGLTGLTANTATAMPTDQVQLELLGSVEPKCAFTSTPTSGQLGSLKGGMSAELGTLGFRCNLPDSPQVSLSIRSENGGLKREGGSEIVPYSAAWALPGAGSFTDASNFKNAVGFSTSAGDIFAGQQGVFKVQVGGGELVAGTYRDRITYTISP